MYNWDRSRSTTHPRVDRSRVQTRPPDHDSTFLVTAVTAWPSVILYNLSTILPRYGLLSRSLVHQKLQPIIVPHSYILPGSGLGTGRLKCLNIHFQGKVALGLTIVIRMEAGYSIYYFPADNDYMEDGNDCYSIQFLFYSWSCSAFSLMFCFPSLLSFCLSIWDSRLPT